MTQVCPAKAVGLRSCTCDTLYEEALLTVGVLHGGPLGSLVAGKVQRREGNVHDQLQPTPTCSEEIPSFLYTNLNARSHDSIYGPNSANIYVQVSSEQPAWRQ